MTKPVDLDISDYFTGSLECILCSDLSDYSPPPPSMAAKDIPELEDTIQEGLRRNMEVCENMYKAAELPLARLPVCSIPALTLCAIAGQFRALESAYHLHKAIDDEKYAFSLLVVKAVLTNFVHGLNTYTKDIYEAYGLASENTES